MAGPVSFRIGLQGDLQAVSIEIERQGESVAEVALEAPELDELIQALAIQRSALAEEVPPSLDPGARVGPIFDPPWQAGAIQGRPGIALSLRHPGLGWVHFLFPPNEAAAIAQWLSGEKSV